MTEAQYYAQQDEIWDVEVAIEDARNSDQAFEFAAELDPEDAALFIAKMISTAALDDKHAAIDDMVNQFKKWMKQ